MKVVIRTKRPGQYFSGRIIEGYFPIEDRNLWYVECDSYAGGGRKISLLSIIDYKERLKSLIIGKLRQFARNNKYVIEFPKN